MISTVWTKIPVDTSGLELMMMPKLLSEISRLTVATDKRIPSARLTIRNKIDIPHQT
jgi:hypothetical protein